MELESFPHPMQHQVSFETKGNLLMFLAALAEGVGLVTAGKFGGNPFIPYHASFLEYFLLQK